MSMSCHCSAGCDGGQAAPGRAEAGGLWASRWLPRPPQELPCPRAERMGDKPNKAELWCSQEPGVLEGVKEVPRTLGLGALGRREGLYPRTSHLEDGDMNHSPREHWEAGSGRLEKGSWLEGCQLASAGLRPGAGLNRHPPIPQLSPLCPPIPLK